MFAILFYMSHLKVIDFQSKRPKPSHMEPKETASVIFTYGVCELLSYAETPSEGAEIVDEVLLNCFGIENSGVTLKQIFFTDGFVKDDEPE